MGNSYKILYEGRSAEIVEKKSRFIAYLLPVENGEEAVAFIEKIKKENWDARHNCYAFVVGQNNELQRFSDDGEPGGTAGKPMLDVLLKEGIHNCVVVVTRYFGGVLLGTGGLVRAYSKAVKEGLKASIIKEKVLGEEIVITTDYNGIGKIQYIIAEMNIKIHEEEYTDVVKVTLKIRKENCDKFINDVTEATAGKVVVRDREECWFLEETSVEYDEEDDI
ncbi:MAG: YigZ family protein [Lachnospiraceae bacterium]|nr:YigZ family protein [Lachnospiraceae bacterium]